MTCSGNYLTKLEAKFEYYVLVCSVKRSPVKIRLTNDFQMQQEQKNHHDLENNIEDKP